MNSPECSAGEPCWPDETIEEHALRYLCAGESGPLDVHVRTCPACWARFADALREAKGVREMLLSVAGRTEQECPAEEALALYLDRALDERDRQAVEAHLSLCRRCQRALVELYREALIVSAPDASLELAATLEDFGALPRFSPECAKSTSDAVPETGPAEPSELASEGEVPEDAVSDEKRKRRYLSR